MPVLGRLARTEPQGSLRCSRKTWAIRPCSTRPRSQDRSLATGSSRATPSLASWKFLVFVEPYRSLGEQRSEPWSADWIERATAKGMLDPGWSARSLSMRPPNAHGPVLDLARAQARSGSIAGTGACRTSPCQRSRWTIETARAAANAPAPRRPSTPPSQHQSTLDANGPER